jgi:hypothetical protein
VASVEKRTDGRAGYVVRWRDEQGKQRKKSFEKKTPADRYKTGIEHSLNTGTYIDPAKGKKPFREYAEHWRSIQPHQPNSADNVRSQLTVHVYPGDRLPADRRDRAERDSGDGDGLVSGSRRQLDSDRDEHGARGLRRCRT